MAVPGGTNGNGLSSTADLNVDRGKKKNRLGLIIVHLPSALLMRGKGRMR